MITKTLSKICFFVVLFTVTLLQYTNSQTQCGVDFRCSVNETCCKFGNDATEINNFVCFPMQNGVCCESNKTAEYNGYVCPSTHICGINDECVLP